MQSNYKTNFPAILLMLAASVAVTAILVELYCFLFDQLGLAAKQRLIDSPVATIFVTPALFWLSAYLCRLCAPNAAGNHMQTALDNLKKDPKNLKKVYSFFDAPLLVIKTLSSLVSTLGGGSLGKEGPSHHISAGIFSIVFSRFPKIFSNIKLESWIAAGGAVGIATVFNAPLAGIAFAAEKLLKFGWTNFKRGIVWTFVAIALIALFFHRTESSFSFRVVDFYLGDHWQFLVLVTLICAVIASPMRLTSAMLCDKFINIKSRWWHAIPLGLGLIVVYSNYYCGTYSFSGGIHTIQQTLSGEITLSYREVIGRIFNTFFTFISGSAGGVIAPAMAIGTGIGSIFSSIFTNIDAGFFLLIGMTSFLTVFLGEPLAAALIVLESTGQQFYVLPFLLAASVLAIFVRKFSDKFFNKL